MILGAQVLSLHVRGSGGGDGKGRGREALHDDEEAILDVLAGIDQCLGFVFADLAAIGTKKQLLQTLVFSVSTGWPSPVSTVAEAELVPVLNHVSH